MSSSELRPIVVDDTDSRVRYTGQGWFQDTGSQDEVGNFGPAYRHTLHGTKSSGSFSFSFTGTSINIFGTITGMIEPHWECFVDKISIGATDHFAFPENNWLLCEQKGLIDGPHEVMVDVTTDGQPFWFDYFQYTPSPGASLDTAVVMVENTDPGLVFSSGWQTLEDRASMTSIAGSQISFDFTGTSLTWMGIIPQELPRKSSSATFSIDGGSPQSFPLVGRPPGSTVATLFYQAFFTTPQLPAGPHTLVVTYTGATQQTPLNLDYILVTNVSMPAKPVPAGLAPAKSDSAPIPSQGPITVSQPQSSDPVSQPSSKGGSQVGTTQVGTTQVGTIQVGANTSTRVNPVPDSSSTPIPSQSSVPSSQPLDNRGIPVGATVGGIIGGFALIALVIFLLWWHKRGKKKNLLLDEPTRPIEVTPFTTSLIYQSSTTNGFEEKPIHQPRPGVTNPDHHVQSLVPVRGQRSVVTHGGVTQAIEAGERGEIAAKPMRQHVVHQDSGVRLYQGRMVVVEDIPPGYTPN